MHKRMCRNYLFSALILLCVTGTPVQAEQTELLRIHGSTTLQPSIEKANHIFHPADGVQLEIRGGGSSYGITALRQGIADIAMVSRSLSRAEQREFSHATIAFDALAIIVNKSNPLARITRNELRDIYTGKITHWRHAIAPNNKIILISKQPGRGSLAVFEQFTNLRSPGHLELPADRSDLIAAHAWEAGANLDVILWVSGLPAAIGFVSLADAKRFIAGGQPIRLLVVDGCQLDQLSVTTGAYPIRREVNLLYRHGDKNAGTFVEFMLSSEGQQLLRQQGLTPAIDLVIGADK